MRYLWVKAGKVANVVEYGATTPPENEDGNDIVLAVTDLESVGDTFDVTDTLKERRISAVELAVFQELFRLTNAVRTLNAQLTISAAQYRTFIKTLI